MNLYPIYLKLEGRSVLVVGGGPIAGRRTERLVEAGARVTVVSPNLIPELKALADRGAIKWAEREFSLTDLDGVYLVLVAAGDSELLGAIRRATEERGIPLGAADDETRSDFHVPAVAAVGPVKIAVSSAGTSPSGSARIRDAVESWLRDEPRLLDEALAQGRSPGRPRGPGKVYLVGAGPGCPELLTLRASELLRTADVVYYDRLVSQEIVARIPARTEKVYVGKEVGCATRANIDGLMVQSALAGKSVVRLKGGDPFIFGRGGEEMVALEAAGIDFEVVPGVSALNAVPGSNRIPLTHRDIAGEIIVRSGHFCEVDAPSPPPNPAARGRTYVYFMPASRLREIVDELEAEGVAASTPAAVIQKGTLPEQRILRSRLGGLKERLDGEPVSTPALLIVGEVVNLLESSRKGQRANEKQRSAEASQETKGTISKPQNSIQESHADVR